MVSRDGLTMKTTSFIFPREASRSFAVAVQNIPAARFDRQTCSCPTHTHTHVREARRKEDGEERERTRRREGAVIPDCT